MITQAVQQVQSEQDQTRFLTLTQCPEVLKQRLQKMKDLGRWARSQGYSWETLWTTEVGSGGMVHVHGVQWGDFVPQAELQARWGHIVDIRAARGGEDGHAGYLGKTFKGHATYIGKTFKASEYSSALALNGGRPFRWTRQFFGGRTADELARIWRINQGWTPEQWERLSIDECREINFQLDAARDAAPNPTRFAQGPKLVTLIDDQYIY